MNSNMDSDKAKLFVGGISRETTNDILRNHFSKYGVVLDSAISVDRITQCPRGFGFVTFSDLSEAEKALQDCHVILGRTVEVKKAIPRSEQQHQIQVQNKGVSDYRSSNDYRCDQFRTKKIFVGGLSASISKEEFKSYFERFGRITDVVVMQDSLTHRPRGFGFITFESEESVENVVVQSFYDLNGRQVEVKRAVPKEGNYGSDGFSKSRYTKNERGAYQSYPPFSPRYMSPCFSPLPYYTSGGVYAYGSNPYDYCYTMGGYGGNGFAVASDASRNFWYGPMVANPQAYQLPYTNAPPSVAYTGGSVGIVGGPGTRGYNGFVPYYVMPPQSYKLNSDSTRFRGSNGEISS